ncbi:MAG: hypothetical protein ABI678_13895 [Kofleriaceae bacterium]
MAEDDVYLCFAFEAIREDASDATVRSLLRVARPSATLALRAHFERLFEMFRAVVRGDEPAALDELMRELARRRSNPALLSVVCDALSAN